MAPMSRNRAHPDGTPSELAIEYYRQRAGAGLIISEATQVNNKGGSYNTPGLYNDKQMSAWKRIVDAVHAEQGKIFVQLWHSGRVSHTSMQPNDEAPIAPSAIRARVQTAGSNGQNIDTSEPRALSINEINALIDDYRHVAVRAKEAGFDGVEIHAANGYLIDQFIRDGSNQRNDLYGGSAENRVRFLLEVTQAVTDVFGSSRVGVRFSPTGAFNDMSDSDPIKSFGTAIQQLNKLNLAYLHMVEVFFDQPTTAEDFRVLHQLRDQWSGTYILNGGLDRETAQQAIDNGSADAVAIGRPFISNPDLPERIRQGAEWAEIDRKTTYGGDHRGYTDYPFLSNNQIQEQQNAGITGQT